MWNAVNKSNEIKFNLCLFLFNGVDKMMLPSQDCLAKTKICTIANDVNPFSVRAI